MLNTGIDSDYLTKGRNSAKKRMKDSFVASDHPVDPKEIASLAGSQFAWAGQELRYKWAHDLLAMMWVENLHHMTLDPRSWRFVPIPLDEQIPRPALNLARDFVETVAGKLVRSTLGGRVIPGNLDPRSRLGARKAEAALLSQDKGNNMGHHRRLRARIGTICGDVHSEVCIEGSPGRRVEVPVFSEVPDGDGGTTPVPVMRGDGTPAMETLELPNERTHTFLPFQIFTNPAGSTIEEKRWIHTFNEHDLELTRQEFPDEADEITRKLISSDANYFANRMANLLAREASHHGHSGYGNIGPMGPYSDPPCLIQVIRYKPDKDYPEGRYFIVAGGVGVVGGPLPFESYMMTHFRYSEVPGSFYSSGLIRDLLGLNRHVEQMLHQAALHRRTLGVPFWLVAERTGGSFTGGSINTAAGNVLTYRARQGKPEPKAVTPHATMDAGFKAEFDIYLDKLMPQIAGLRGVLSGDQPRGVYSSAHFKALRAEASDRLYPKTEDWRDSEEKETTLRLKAIKKSPAWQIAQQVNYPGPPGRRVTAIVQAADFSDTAVYEIQSTRNDLDEVTKTQATLDAFHEGLANKEDEEVRYKALVNMGVPELIGESNVDRERAQAENVAMAMGEEVEIHSLENLAIHLQEHRAFIMSEDFEILRYEHPDRAEYIEEHALKTKEMLGFMVQEESRKMAALQDPGGQQAIGSGAPPVPALPGPPGPQ